MGNLVAGDNQRQYQSCHSRHVDEDVVSQPLRIEHKSPGSTKHNAESNHIEHAVFERQKHAAYEVDGHADQEEVRREYE